MSKSLIDNINTSIRKILERVEGVRQTAVEAKQVAEMSGPTIASLTAQIKALEARIATLEGQNTPIVQAEEPAQ
jgi:hypothetical protein